MPSKLIKRFNAFGIDCNLFLVCTWSVCLTKAHTAGHILNCKLAIITGWLRPRERNLTVYWSAYITKCHHLLVDFPQTMSLIDVCQLYKSVWFNREQPIFTTKAHVFHIDPATKKNWLPSSQGSVNVSFYYDSNRSTYRIISVDGSKVGLLHYSNTSLLPCT